MSFRYTSDVEVSELETKPRPLSGDEQLLIVQDERTYKCTVNELLGDLNIQVNPIYTSWNYLTSLPVFNGVTLFPLSEDAVQLLEIPEYQLFHFVDITYDDPYTADLILPADSAEVVYKGVRVLVRADLPVGAVLNVREELVDAVPLRTATADGQSFIWTGIFVHNGTQWRWVPVPSDALQIG